MSLRKLRSSGGCFYTLRFDKASRTYQTTGDTYTNSIEPQVGDIVKIVGTHDFFLTLVVLWGHQLLAVDASYLEPIEEVEQVL